MHEMRTLIEDCCGWNKKTWADAVEFSLSRIPHNLNGKKVLEIGASRFSSLAPIFAHKGAEVLCSYLHEEGVREGQLKMVLNKYHMSDIAVIELDIRDVRGTYDIIILKSVFGGVCR